MRKYCVGMLLLCVAALSACAEKPDQETTVAAAPINLLTGSDDEKRIISIQTPTQCSLIVKRGRKIAETINPKSCQLTKSTDGFITSVAVIFDAPCKQYLFKNVIGTHYFLDEKTIASKNKACALETFNPSYKWDIEES
jgi:hypothetical protein